MKKENSMMRSRLMLTTAVAFMIALPAMADTMPADSGAATGVSAVKGETVDERITNLHDELKITSDEDKKWEKVARAMRENASKMETMKEKTQAQQNMTAEDDLKNYQQFAQAHVDGLKNLRSAFDSLYESMPADQKQVADQVFQKKGH
jgi:tRNA U34 5-carboxymethylaminomethyl modifying enzyme MnmG/GidA